MWNNKIKNSLDQLLNTEGKNYAIFDCDNTILMNDIQFACTHYILKKKKLFVLPKDLKKFMLNKFPEEYNIINDFCNIYEKAYNSDSNSEEYLEFLANFYDTVEYFYFKYNKFDLSTLFCFKGLNKNEAIQIIKESINYHNNVEFGIENWVYEDNISSYKTGLKITNEMYELIKDLSNNNIDVYIISASIKEQVETVLEPLKPYIKGIYAKELEIINDKYTGEIKNNTINPVGEGKSKIISEILKLKYQKDPILVAGDSMGDYNMLTDFNDTIISLIIDRNRQGEFKNIFTLDENRYLRQCVDETIGEFIAEDKSITI